MYLDLIIDLGEQIKGKEEEGEDKIDYINKKTMRNEHRIIIIRVKYFFISEL